ncbi:universal stress protein [Streptomyces europaeiscabiei]|uniref:universal stress protein n=3 Tax=Streptomyces TaxID=1883 RepID=UPI0029B00FD7|nr:universal stress protein [Streptomyces europaeiscabiei]MDX3637106.1 universal stress protein [Streptomyces europaeiscabiei]MDX3655250.1 universal stress protein [Streptomyces europaeiscabiei]
MTLQHVVVGTDGSLVAVRALDWASDEAVRRGAGLRVVYAVPDRDEAGPVLGAAVSRVSERHPALPVETAAAEGGTVRALVRESEHAVLTVVGTRGFGGLTGLLFGSVSLRLAAQVRGPLLVVRGDHPCDDGKDVLLGLESEADANAAAYAFQEAERRGAPLRVLHSWTHRQVTPELPSLLPATSPGQERLARHGRAEEAVPRFALTRLRERHPAVDVETRTVRTGAAHSLLEATREAAVVVIGAHRHGGAGTRLGPVAHTLLHRSHCPVVVVPDGG